MMFMLHLFRRLRLFKAKPDVSQVGKLGIQSIWKLELRGIMSSMSDQAI
jgi:hypothetical protein